MGGTGVYNCRICDKDYDRIVLGKLNTIMKIRHNRNIIEDMFGIQMCNKCGVFLAGCDKHAIGIYTYKDRRRY